MRHIQKIWALAVLVVAINLFWTAIAYADRVDRLITTLQTDSAYKIRMQAASMLGKLRDTRAVPALMGALRDEAPTVRTVAAAALAQIGDKRAVPELKRLLETEQNHMVRSQFERSLKSLSSVVTRTGGGGRFFLTIGKIAVNTSKSWRQMADVFRQALIKSFQGVDGVQMDISGQRPSPQELRQKQLKAYIIDGTIISLEKVSRGSVIEFNASIRVSLSTYPENSMKAFYSGGTSTEAQANTLRPNEAESIFKELLEAAALEARQNIVQSYLSTQ